MMGAALARGPWARLRFRDMSQPRSPSIRSVVRRRSASPVAGLGLAGALAGALLSLVALVGGSPVHAGTVTGRVELPAAEKRDPSETRGYLEPVDNSILPVQMFNPTPYLLVVLETQQAIDVAAPPQATYELRGESFSRPVLGVVKGQEVVIRNSGLGPRSLVAKEDPALLPKGTLNVTGTKSFRVAEAGKIYTIVDESVPHLRGCIVSVSTPFHATPDREGRFSFDDVPAGSYKARVFFRDRWLSTEAQVTVPAGPRAKAEVRLPIPAGYRAGEAGK
jgi:hypothetical protein